MAAHGPATDPSGDTARHVRRGSGILPPRQRSARGDGQHARPPARPARSGSRGRRRPPARWPAPPLLFGVIAAVIVLALVVVASLTPFGPFASTDPADGPGPGTAAPADVATPAALPTVPPLTAPAAPVEARIQAEQVFAEHSLMLAALTRARLEGSDESSRAAAAVLESNGADVGRILGEWAGQDVAARAAVAWSSQVSAINSYAEAVADGDRAAAEQAHGDAMDAIATLNDVVVSVALPGSTVQAVLPTLQRHAELQLEQVDSLAEDDYQAARIASRDALVQAANGGVLLVASLAAKDAPLPADFDSPERQLQSRLGRLLGENVALVLDTTAAGLSGSEEFPAAAAALEASSADLTAAVGAVLGADAAVTFAGLWADRTNAAVAYGQAAAQADAAARGQAVGQLEQADEALAALLETQTAGRIPAQDANAVLEGHRTAVTDHLDAAVAGDATTGTEAFSAAFRGAFEFAALVAPAMSAAAADSAPRGGVQTGGGGMADVVGAR